MRGPRVDVSSSVTVAFAPNVCNGSGAGWWVAGPLLPACSCLHRHPSLFFLPKNIGISMVVSRTALPVHTVNAT